MEKLSVSEFINLDKAALAGKVLCFPTDTVYGLGALYNDELAIKKIYNMKNRSQNKPLANLCSNIVQITDLGIEIPPYVKKIIDKYWPGALTIIFKKGNDKISFRIPDSKIALQIINRFSIITTTSVNESGEKELNSLNEIYSLFGEKIDYYIIDEAHFSYQPSTVIDVSDGQIKLVRQGSAIIE